MVSPGLGVRRQQLEWAKQRGIVVDNAGYTQDLRSNLFQSLTPCAEAEFKAGDGAEMGKPGQRGKMQALHSSSALACNVFDYWRGRDTTPLAKALEIDAPICSIAFEKKYPTGLRGKAPNLDVVLIPAVGPTVAIESKFLEPYGSKGKKPGFKTKYFPKEHDLWKDAGFPQCQSAAAAVFASEQKNKRLNAEQLFKHILGLSHTASPWSLLYLWYDPAEDTDENHTDEIENFARSISADPLGFRAMSYQDLFMKLAAAAKPDDFPYVEYLRERYFPRIAI
jgi:hypothetical protein